jgi:hypothetical protein
MQEILSKTRTSPSHQNVRGESAKSLCIAAEGQGPSLLTWHPFTTLRAWLFDKSRGRSSGPSSRLLCLARQHLKPTSEPMKTRYGCFVIAVYGNSNDRLCGLVVRVLGYRSGGPGSIPGTTSKKK